MTRTPGDIQDELLVLQCQGGDAAAVRELVARWRPRLAGLSWRLTGEREAAQDVVQDAMLAIVRGLGRLEDPATFRTWAYRIVARKCVDWLRRQVAHRSAVRGLEAQRQGDGAVDAAPLEPGDEESCVRGAMAVLSPEQRAMVALHYLDGMSVSEIAQVFGTPAGTVKSRLFQARVLLKQAIEKVKP